MQHITIWELVSRGRSPYQALGWTLSADDREKIQWAIEYMNLSSLQHNSLDCDSLDCVSGGERQRAWIAMVLAQDTDLVLLDEPVTYLDLKYQWGLLKIICEIKSRLNKTFVVVLHDINHALAIANRFIVLKDGEIYASGYPCKIMTADLIKDVYDVSAHICKFDRCSKPVVVSAGLN